MHSRSIALIVISLGSLLVTPAYALRANTYVAASGTDTGACSFSAPCRTFAYAISQVESGGVVTALDSSGYNPFTISTSVTIAAPPGVTPIIQAASGGTAITINSSTAITVTLRGLTIDGVSTGQNGITWIGTGSGGELNIIDCVVKGFTNDGVQVTPAFAAVGVVGTVSISNSIIMDNVNNGIEITTQNNSNTIMFYAIDRTTVSGNGLGGMGGHSSGILINSANGGIAGSLSSVRVLRNNNFGVNTMGNNSALNSFITNSVLALNGVNDLNITGGGNLYLFGANTITYFANSGTGFTYSDGTNDIPFFGGNALQSVSRR